MRLLAAHGRGTTGLACHVLTAMCTVATDNRDHVKKIPQYSVLAFLFHFCYRDTWLDSPLHQVLPGTLSPPLPFLVSSSPISRYWQLMGTLCTPFVSLRCSMPETLQCVNVSKDTTHAKPSAFIFHPMLHLYTCYIWTHTKNPRPKVVIQSKFLDGGRMMVSSD